jgi:hypothetical protein
MLKRRPFPTTAIEHLSKAIPMSHDRSSTWLVVRYVSGLLLAGTCAALGATEFTGRGVFNFSSGSGCPYSALSADGQCNRVALDNAETRATLDSTEHTIRFHNTHSYSSMTVVGDVLLQGSGQARDGRRVPLSFHAVLSKSGDKWSLNSHVHAPVKGNFTEVQMDLYQVEVTGKDSARVILVPARITEALIQPGLAARLASEIVQVRDNRTEVARDPDITIAVGAGRVAKSVMRAQLRAGDDTQRNFDALLKQATWAVNLEALTGQIPDQVAQRELFLYGLDGQPLLKPLVERGFKKHEKLTIGAVNGKGYLRYGTQQQEYPGAEAAARAFMQQSFIGLVLGWQHMERDAGGR